MVGFHFIRAGELLVSGTLPGHHAGSPVGFPHKLLSRNYRGRSVFSTSPIAISPSSQSRMGILIFSKAPCLAAGRALLRRTAAGFALTTAYKQQPRVSVLERHTTANLQQHPVDVGQNILTEMPATGSAAAENRDGFPAAPSALPCNVYSAEGPSEGSYAKELLQYVRNATELSANVGDSNGAASSTEWLIDWLLALKLGLGVPWCVALPVAGCLMRLLTLPIAIDSAFSCFVTATSMGCLWYCGYAALLQERDRRQRQLVDPQFSRLKNTQEYQRLRMETKQFLKKHGIGALPTSLFQMILFGLAVSLATPALRGVARDPERWKGFAMEQPGWLESLALPDSTGLTAVLCWLVLVSTMAASWVVSSKIQRRSPSVAAATGISSPLIMRGVSVGGVTIFALYSGMQLPAAALLFLVPAFALQSAFMRIFRLRSVESCLHFVPEGLRPLQQTYVALLERREPALVAAWRRRAADARWSNENVAEATTMGPAATSHSIVQLWKELSQKDRVVTPHYLKTWAEQVAEKNRERLPGPKLTHNASQSFRGTRAYTVIGLGATRQQL